MEYKLILLKNSKYLHTLYTCKKITTAYSMYHKKISDNNNIVFPKKYVNSNGIEPVKYHLCLVKDYDNKDPKRYIKDRYGRNIFLDKINNKWSLVQGESYDIEELFYIYTSDHNRVREPISYIVKILAKHAYKKSAM